MTLSDWERPGSGRGLLVAALILVTLLALILRLWRLDKVPPGWRDDELINSLVISQKALDGNWSVYYADASGHEALFHWLTAGTLAMFGPGVAGIRLLPALLGTLTVPLTYGVAYRLLGKKGGVVAAAGLALSFWSLMYSRIGIRHISLPVFMLASFYYFLRGLEIGSPRNHKSSERQTGRFSLFISALFLGLSFYTYFASRGTPLIMVALVGYLALLDWEWLRRKASALLLALAVALLMAAPLGITLLTQPQAEARVEELALPLVEAREGNFQPLTEHVLRTLAMAHTAGDEEWLYNIPFRPLFGPVGAAFFWIGVAIALYDSAAPLWSRVRSRGSDHAPNPVQRQRASAGAFLLLWWLAGISPAFFSVPPSSLGHTIVAQSSVYCLAALPVAALARPSWSWGSQARWRLLAGVVALFLLLSIAVRDLPDYFQRWPSRGMTRFLYRAEINHLADYLNQHSELTDFGVAGLLAGPWDRLALEIDLSGEREDIRSRWYDPQRAALVQIAGRPAMNFVGYPLESNLFGDRFRKTDVAAGQYRLVEALEPGTIPAVPARCFANGLCLWSAEFDRNSRTLNLTWEVASSLSLPALPLISNPPPPGVYAGPRLSVFGHLVDGEGNILSSDDGLWVDIATLYPGDRFIQRHQFAMGASSGAVRLLFGLYDPMTGHRILTDDGRDHVALDLER